MYCSRCGAQNPDVGDVKFCRTCGAALSTEQPEAVGAYPPSAQGAAPPPSGAYTGYQPAQSTPQPAPYATPYGTMNELVQPAFPYGGFWIRVLASLIDGVIISMIGGVIGFVFGLVMGASGSSNASIEAVCSLLGGVASITFSVVCPPVRGATPGKLIFGYHIVRAEDGKHIGYWRSLGRYLAQIISALVFCLGYIWVAMHPRKQGWHDLMAGTYVVKKEFVQR